MRLICVGGPFDGETRHTNVEVDHINFAIEPEVKVVDYSEGRSLNSVLTDVITYKRHRFNLILKDDVVVFVPCQH